ncbi:phosphate ABC transporter permease PstA [bacterium]|nr:phosphate ABC transporter permease PstA [bacterium]
MKPRSMNSRRWLDVAIKTLSGVAALGGCFMLGWILFVLVARGAGALNWDFFTKLPTPPGVEGGGVANAIVGTLAITAMAALVGVPLGMLGGVYLAEFGRGTRLAAAIRFSANILMGVPSIIIGIFVYAMLVQPMGRFSGYAGSLSLAIIMLPIVVRTTEDMLAMVPGSLREAAMALGAPRWKVSFGIYFRAAKAGILTGILLAVARVSGETAPLLFTSLNSPYWNRFDSVTGAAQSFAQPTANLTVTIFNQAMSPYPDWQQSAWAASLLITFGVLALTIVSRFMLQRRNG